MFVIRFARYGNQTIKNQPAIHGVFFVPSLPFVLPFVEQRRHRLGGVRKES